MEGLIAIANGKPTPPSPTAHILLEEQCAQLAKHYFQFHKKEQLVPAPKNRRDMLQLPTKFRDQFVAAELAHLEKIGPNGCDIYVEEPLPDGERAMGNRWVYS